MVVAAAMANHRLSALLQASCSAAAATAMRLVRASPESIARVAVARKRLDAAHQTVA